MLNLHFSACTDIITMIFDDIMVEPNFYFPENNIHFCIFSGAVNHE